ncbi:UNVERIFIED_CONTAM: hypothetical protein Slati_1526200 [Sesamum latifolium]|uniref:Uncharacterized protein n=1 Tax=Sesamum latifolium TaxID=2727402 RepID=A0AAW2X777_9LAMI
MWTSSSSSSSAAAASSSSSSSASTSFSSSTSSSPSPYYSTLNSNPRLPKTMEEVWRDITLASDIPHNPSGHGVILQDFFSKDPPPPPPPPQGLPPLRRLLLPRLPQCSLSTLLPITSAHCSFSPIISPFHMYPLSIRPSMLWFLTTIAAAGRRGSPTPTEAPATAATSV